MRLRTVRTTANRNKLMILFLFLVVNNYEMIYNKKDGTAKVSIFFTVVMLLNYTG